MIGYRALRLAFAVLAGVGISAEGCPAATSDHWAFQPLQRPDVPGPSSRPWLCNPVDAFIVVEQDKRGLAPAREASRRVLIRRVTLDLTGLPPAREEVEAFVADADPDAFERLVDRLLGSPHYGERWGRHWLDVARWADSEGYENNHLRPFAWRYRDYVVRSFNNDKPVDQFMRQQIAGDELVPYSDENLIATGFLAAARYSGNEEDKAMQRNDVLVDIVNATASAFLSLTLGCAQCHDHKTDPITQQDYYRFQGFFVQGQMNNLVLKDAELWEAYEAARKRETPESLEPARQLRKTLLDDARKQLVEEAKAKLTPDERQALETPEASRTDVQQELAHQAARSLEFSREDVEKSITGDDKKLYDALRSKIEAIEKKLPPKPQAIGFYSPATSPTPVEVLQMEANFPLPYQPDELKKTRPRLLVRGDVHRPGPELEMGWPAVFGPTPQEKLASAPRTALAEWLADRANPLTARVWANRVWQYHFGRGLCATPGDFGTQTTRPAHAELLDYLACELIDRGWSTKHLHRLIVTSATYRQSSEGASSADRDPENVYYARWSPRRLEAEPIRDAVLAVSGELDPSIGGPSVQLVETNKWLNEPPEETGKVLRRSLYLVQRRDSFPPMLTLFDGPPAIESCARRHVSTVAHQPLFMLNSKFMLDRARAFAARVAAEAGADVDCQIDLAFQLGLARPPDRREQQVLRSFFDPEQSPESRSVQVGVGDPACGEQNSAPGADLSPLVRACQLLFNLNEFVYVE